ncbi:MAG TPA: ABC transporter permease, partial [Thermoanaerobaculia bacterium]|nr:ABC transporter permease [Thermoanaerobaculia bacterium]
MITAGATPLLKAVRPASGSPAPILIVPSRGWASLQLRELWAYRELLYFLVWRDVKVRYKQTVLGAAWAVLQPLLTMIVFTVFFGRLAKVGSEGLPYPLFSYAGLLPWIFFAQALAQSSDSLVGSSHLITKVYFPRLVIPVASALAPAVDFGVALVVLLGMMASYGVWPTIHI